MPRDDPLILQEPPPMLGQLTGPSRPPLSGGKPRRLVILLHGLGADGNDLIGLQQRWGRVVPDAEFISPNAPFPCDMAPYGYQWSGFRTPHPPPCSQGCAPPCHRSTRLLTRNCGSAGLQKPTRRSAASRRAR